MSTGLRDGASVREASQSLARRARDAFRDACEAVDEDQSETSYMAMRASLEELWDYAKYRDVPFRDLLGLLEVATKHTELVAFNETQRDVLRNAFQDLPRWLLDYDIVDGHIGKFAEFGIDITGPIRSKTPKRIRVTIEEVVLQNLSLCLRFLIEEKSYGLALRRATAQNQ